MIDKSTLSNSSYRFYRLLNTKTIWILFAFSMAVTLTVSYHFHHERENVSLQHFNDASKQVVFMVQETLSDQREIVQSGAAYYNASEFVSPDEWNTYIRELQLLQRYPAIKRIKLLLTDAADTQTALRNPGMYESMQRSKDTGETSISMASDCQAMCITIPLYQKNKPHDTLDQKRDAHIGWVMGIINTHELLSGIQGEKARYLDFTLRDANNHPLFTTLTTHTKHNNTHTLSIMGKNFTIETFSTPASLDKIHLDTSPFILLGGTILNLIVLISLLAFNQKRKIVEDNNRELNMLNTLIGESNDMIFIIRIDDGYVEYINDTSTKMLGYTLEEIREIGIDSFRRPLKAKDTFFEHLQELKKMGRLTDYAMLTRKDGSEFPIEANVRLVHYNGIDYNIALVRDISENELYQKKLSDVTHHLNEAQHIAKLGSWYLNLETGALEWSDEIYVLFEIDPATHNPSYEGFLDAIHPEDRDLVNTAYQHSVDTHTSYDYVHRLLMKDGRIKYVREQGKNFYSPDGQPIASRGTVHDITEEILLRQRLKEKNITLTQYANKLKLASQAAGVGIWLLDFETNTFVADEKVLELYEMSSDLLKVPLAFEEWTSRCHPDDVEEALKILQTGIETLSPVDMLFRIVVPSGTKYIHSTGVIEYDKNKKPIGYVGTNQDVTIYKELEESRIIAKEAAENANQTKSDFLANMSHEIRTPLNGVIGLTELLLQTDLQPLQREYLHKSEVASKALLNVLNNILDYSKIEAKKLTLEAITFNLYDVIDNLIAMLSYKAEQKQLSLEAHIDSNVPRILIGDPLRLQQILSNLVVNALKFTEKGFVRISITSISYPEDCVKLIFAISDSGIGISQEDQASLFQPFSQVDTSFTRKYGGSGLGLMITKELVDLMQGEISVQSRLGEGSTFTFTALFHCAAEFMCELPKPTSSLPQNKQLHLLLVEDNDLNQLVAVERLKQMGITCSIANNGLEAVEMVQKETFDAVLMDLQMPVMDGLSATREIRKLGYSDLPIIALSAAVLQDDLAMAIEAGMNDHISKPIDKILLHDVLAKWLNI